MDHADILNRLKILGGELAEIADHNRQYFAQKNHRPQEKAQHQELRERVRQIRAELYALLPSDKAA